MDPSSTNDRPGHGPVAVAGTDLRLSWSVRGTTGELELGPHGDVDPEPAALAAVVAAVDEVRRSRPDVSFHLAADHPVDRLEPWPEALADAAGLANRRDLLQLRRVLPVEADHPARAAAPPVAVRPIDVGADVDAWLRVNNRAFASHPDQGAETVATFERRLDVERSDPSGFLVADDPARRGELSGFCWTKVHPATAEDPELGEIYVIGVDPSHRGEGLGPSFVLAGLDHLAGLGIATANLYVDADNEPARRLYDRLGFHTHQRRRVYTS